MNPRTIQIFKVLFVCAFLEAVIEIEQRKWVVTVTFTSCFSLCIGPPLRFAIIIGASRSSAISNLKRLSKDGSFSRSIVCFALCFLEARDRDHVRMSAEIPESEAAVGGKAEFVRSPGVVQIWQLLSIYP